MVSPAMQEHMTSESRERRRVHGYKLYYWQLCAAGRKGEAEAYAAKRGLDMGAEVKEAEQPPLTVTMNGNSVVTKVDLADGDLRDAWECVRKVASGEAPSSGFFAAFQRLDEAFGFIPHVELPKEGLSPAIPVSFPSDPIGVSRRLITKAFLNRRMWELELDNGMLGVLHAKVGTFLRVGWRVYVKPQVQGSADYVNFVLVGEYNKFGDRLK